MDGGGLSAAPIVGWYCLIARPGQSRNRAAAVNDCHPPVGCLNPLILPHAAHIALVGKAVFMRQVGQDITVDIRCFHLSEASRHSTKEEGDLGYIFVGGQAKRRRGSVQGVVLQGVEVIGQHALSVGKVGLEYDLIVEPRRVGASDDLIQSDCVGRQRVTPVEAIQRHSAVVPDILEGVTDLLARHDLRVTTLADKTLV